MPDKITLRDIYNLIDDLRCEMRELYVTKDQFYPVKTIAYGIAGMAVTAVIGALLALVVKANGN